VVAGGGGGKILLIFDSTDRFGSLIMGWTGNETGRTSKNRIFEIGTIQSIASSGG
jgi:hypothetical protein